MHTARFAVAYNRGRLENKAAFIVRSAGQRGAGEDRGRCLRAEPATPLSASPSVSGSMSHPRGTGLDWTGPSPPTSPLARQGHCLRQVHKAEVHTIPWGAARGDAGRPGAQAGPVESLAPSSCDRPHVYQHDSQP